MTAARVPEIIVPGCPICGSADWCIATTRKTKGRAVVYGKCRHHTGLFRVRFRSPNQTLSLSTLDSSIETLATRTENSHS